MSILSFDDNRSIILLFILTISLQALFDLLTLMIKIIVAERSDYWVQKSNVLILNIFLFVLLFDLCNAM